ncbi:tRNA (adenosine(37)-N6)-threonylcarbamoyltransferase complex dimerization subunit type 1 TsaB [Desulfoplanes formicivorans]|uniref:tRNA threonylcarbamoyladenosine biosynthesis protein TsaB n=1 Tax=Desulfoplanes formicivorans TaxID=1592317 RepID=A0A194ABP0_9BACT|nr:tRNA (adenosine(37)-N6)-threonylcarbamoyltransferase complex dimerization subunit type 1 TsaB [Desulfoplanes formicivorans]GAU07572.1 tRNA threonylcarbamoyladenosine biosynthesis protein TsaB [Desulfoplanes formicivorans]
MTTRPILAINGTEELLQVVIGTDTTLLFCSGINGPGRTMRHLLPMIDEGLSRLGLNLADCRGIACTRGPGSFTGIRVVLATIEGMSRASGVPIAGLDYLPLLAGDLMAHWHGEAWVLTYARKNQVYMQGFSMPETTPLGPARACSHDQAADMLCARPGKVLVGGSGITKNQTFFNARLASSAIHMAQRDVLSSHALLSAACKEDFTRESIPPLYLRASDAEDNLAAIARKRGISLDDARQRIPSQE